MKSPASSLDEPSESVPHRLPELRIDYDLATLDEHQMDGDPVRQFQTWLDDAVNARIPEPHSMGLSTVNPDGTPSSRNVLLRGIDHDRAGFSFYTNRTSQKGQDLAGRPVACALFSWLGLQRQVRASGAVEVIGDDESDRYFATRPRESQLGAWVSAQSQVISSRRVLDDALAEVNARFHGVEVPRPPHWGGYRLVADSFEFWQGRTARLHDRLRYRRADSPDEVRPAKPTGWIIERLAP